MIQHAEVTWHLPCLRLSGKQKSIFKSLRMQNRKNRLLFPLVVCAIVSVATFSGIGVAAITGYLPVTQSGFGQFLLLSDTSGVSRDVIEVPAPSGPIHVGLTRQSGSDPVKPTKPFQYRPGQRVDHAKRGCQTCGVVQSIEPRESAVRTIPGGASIAGGLADALLGNGDNANGAMVVGFSAGEYQAMAPRGGPSYIVRVKMEDGSFRTIYENQRPTFSIGERVRLINGSVISVS